MALLYWTTHTSQTNCSIMVVATEDEATLDTRNTAPSAYSGARGGSFFAADTERHAPYPWTRDLSDLSVDSSVPHVSVIKRIGFRTRGQSGRGPSPRRDKSMNSLAYSHGSQSELQCHGGGPDTKRARRFKEQPLSRSERNMALASGRSEELFWLRGEKYLEDEQTGHLRSPYEACDNCSFLDSIVELSGSCLSFLPPQGCDDADTASSPIDSTVDDAATWVTFEGW